MVNKVTLPPVTSPANPYKVTLTLTSTTGAFTGKYTLPGATPALNRNVTFYGQIVRTAGPGTYQGSGYFLLPQVPVAPETLTTSPKNSGSVLLVPAP